MAFKYKITRRLASEHKVMLFVSAVIGLIGCMDSTGATDVTVPVSCPAGQDCNFVSSNGRVRLFIPAAAIPEPGLNITAAPAIDPIASMTLVPGTAWDVGPTGTVFNSRARLSIDYATASVQGLGGVLESELGLYKDDSRQWSIVDSMVQDSAGSTLTAWIAGLSVYGILGAPVDTVIVSPAPAVVVVDGTVQLTAEPRSGDQTVLPDRSVTWSTGDATVATVDASGVVTGVAVGQTTILATASQGQGGVVTTVTSAVGAPGNVTDLLVVGQTSNTLVVQLTEVHDGAGQPASYAVRYAERPIAWDSASEFVVQGNQIGATLSFGIEGLQPSTAYDVQCTSFRGTLGSDAVFSPDLCNIATGTTDPLSSDPAVVTVIPASVSMAPGGTVTLTAEVRNSYGDLIPGAAITWSSSDVSVATVTTGGVVTGVDVGTATITATSGGLSGSATATISASEPTDLIGNLIPANYTTAQLQQGDQFYIDRPYTITDIDPSYQNWLWILTANDDKAVTADSFVVFDLTDSAIVAVGYDRFATTLPNWLQGWQQSPNTIGVSGVNPFRILYRSYGPGTVALGGNLAAGAVGAESNYVVLLNRAGDALPIDTGSISVQTTSTGQNLDADGYTVTVDGGPTYPIGANGSLTVSALTAGDHTVALSDVAANCSVTGANPRTVSVPASGTAATTFEIGCVDSTGNLEVTVSTTGPDPDPDGYGVTVDGGPTHSVGVNGSVTVSALTAGDHTVALSDVAVDCSVTGANPRTVSVPLNGTAATTFDVLCIRAGDAPYSPSPVIGDITFDFSTLDQRAPGSDNWPVTWADDGHQYTSWGDGGGFGGTNGDGRVSLGVARVEGSATSYSGHNVWGGLNPENPATFGGKSYGILSVDGVLYMWVSPGSGTTAYQKATVYRSPDHGASWTPASWDFVQGDGMIMPTFLQFGQDYQGARDTYVYTYANHLKNASTLEVQMPGEIALMRVPQTAILDRAQYEFFAGLDGSNNPIWVTDLTQRQPVFEDAKGVGWTTSMSYNPGLGRYLLTTEHTATSQGNIGIFDAPEPWGPWTTVLYDTQFGAPDIEASTFFWNFSNKWLSADGKDFVMILTGVGATDAWISVRGTMSVR